jgi:hypothetical protein
MSILAAAFQASIEATFTTPVTVVRITRTRTADGGWDLTTADAGTFAGRLENRRRLAEEQLLQGQQQNKVFYTLYYPLSVGTSVATSTPTRLNPDAAWLTLADRLRIGGHTYEITHLPDPDTDAPARQITIWRNSAEAP